jgi:DNA-directed RNA polymerase specialized sigma24 family protein
MDTPGEVTLWVARLKAGDMEAAQRLWTAYFRRLVGLAWHKLQGRPRAAADEEDVALSAFHSFFRGVEGGRFPQLADRDDVWHLLMCLTARKACRLLRDESRLKRGGGAVRHLSAVEGDEEGLAEVIGREPTPEFAALFAEEVRARLEALGDDELRAVAWAKADGYSIAEVAARLEVTVRTVERRLCVIRKLWSEEAPR